MATLTNYFKICDLKQQKYILSQFQRTEIWDQYCCAEIKTLGASHRGSSGESGPYLSQLLATTGIPWLVTVSL